MHDLNLDHLLDELADRIAGRLHLPQPEPTTSEPWRLLTLTEVSDRLGRSERTVRKWVTTGELPHVKLDGGALAFELEDVRAFVDARRVGSDAPGLLALRLQSAGNGAFGAGLQITDGAANRRVA